MTISELVRAISTSNDCEILTPRGIPTVAPGLKLPKDVNDFFTICGGATLWKNSPYTVYIVDAEHFELANPLIVGDIYPEDISSTWYIVAKDTQANYLTIDCHPTRLGRCYDSFFDRHGVAGSCPIIALSFSSLLENLWNGKGSYWYWLDAQFGTLGDAYDGT